MTSPTDGKGTDDAKRARDLQSHVDELMQDEHDNEQLLEKLDGLIKELFELAQAWDRVDADMATRVRSQEHDLHLLRGRLERLSEAEADEAKETIAKIKAELAKIRPGQTQ